MDGALFCEWCGASLALPAAVSAPVTQHAERPFPSGLYLVIIGIVLMIAGGIVYAIAWDQTMHDFWNGPDFTDTSTLDSYMDLMTVSYIVSGIGTIILFAGMLMLVIRE